MKGDFGRAYRRIMMAWTMEEAGEYRALARAIHPDLNGDEPRSGEAMAKLQELNSAVGSYLKLPKVDYAQKMDVGDIADVYLVKAGDRHSMLKVASDKRDNDLLETEAKRLWSIGGIFAPLLEETMMLDGKAGNMLEYHRRDDVVALEYLDKGLDFRHVVWMARRLMGALGKAHEMGFVHGAVLPRHLLFMRSNHGIRLVDWCYSVGIGEKLRVMVASQDEYYPPEIKRGVKVGPDFDIYMAAKCLGRITDIPKKFRPWFEKATLGQPRNRWQNAWEAYDSITKLAKEVYGPPHFMEFPD